MDYQLFWKPRFLLGEGMLVVDDFCCKMSIIFGGVEMCQIGDDALCIKVVDDGTILWYLFLVKEVVGTEAMLVKVRQTMSE